MKLLPHFLWPVLIVGRLAGTPDDDFFEGKIRPLLVERCYECHAEKKTKGGLRLDSAPGWRAGSDSGPVIIPGDPAQSPLIQAVRYTDADLQMPPKEKLPTAEIALLEEWVRRGAPDTRLTAPALAGAKPPPMTLEQARAHWAFQPVVPPQLPPGPPGLHPIDRFIRPRLIAAGLAPNPPADPRTLVRRAYLTLLGLPPSFDRVQQFAAQPSPTAWATLIDQLLARSEYGQRWGRHWLDVARYADTTEKSTDGERRIPFAHTYRDYVIDSLNQDRPFNRFILEQIAADRLPESEKPDLRALGLLTVGRRFEGNLEATELIIDDRIDVIGRGILGVTLACARCHDHKFDAIPTADYYSLFGIIASSDDPMDLPEIGETESTAAVIAYRKKRAELFAEYEKHIDTCVSSARQRLRELAPEYLRYLVEESQQHRTVDGFIPLDSPRGLLVRGGPPRWAALIRESIQRGEPFFTVWPLLFELSREGFAAAAQAILTNAATDPARAEPAVVAALLEKAPSTMHEVAEVFGRLITAALEKPADSRLAAIIEDPKTPLQFTREEIKRDFLRFVTEHQLVSRPEGEAAGKIRTKLTVLEAQAPVERAQSLTVNAEPLNPRILVRGDRLKPSSAVPRRIPQLLASVEPATLADDGRLALARALASPQNPLTARVIVNRIWQQHFGRGLVTTPDDFGARGERPSHPELLDHLAAWLMQNDWSLKALHRYLMTSAAWQQSSGWDASAGERDPANEWLWRMSPRRLEFEPLRDSLLRVAGKLDTRTGGRSAPLTDDNNRRAVYGYTDRFRIPALLRNFDVANPDQSIARRSETSHPLQALFFLNSPFVLAQAEAVNRHPEISEMLDVDARVAALYRRILIRLPDLEEARLARHYLGATPASPAWWQFTQVLLLSNEFSFSD